jgi:hypothetical protein
MPFPLAAAIVLTAILQVSDGDRGRAEELARAGRTAEALELFTRIVAADPAVSIRMTSTPVSASRTC